MDALIDGLGWIRDAGKWRDLDRKFSLGSLLPKNLHKFWRYTGSFTMPPCEEVVTWTVLEDTVGISERQVETNIVGCDHRNRMVAIAANNEKDTPPTLPLPTANLGSYTQLPTYPGRLSAV